MFSRQSHEPWFQAVNTPVITQGLRISRQKTQTLKRNLRCIIPGNGQKPRRHGSQAANAASTRKNQTSQRLMKDLPDPLEGTICLPKMAHAHGGERLELWFLSLKTLKNTKLISSPLKAVFLESACYFIPKSIRTNSIEPTLQSLRAVPDS